MGLRDQAAFLTLGGVTFRRGRKDQWSRSSWEIVSSVAGGFARIVADSGHSGAGVDPESEQVDLGGGQGLALRGHSLAVLGGDELEEAALRGLTGDDAGLSGVTTLKGAGLEVEPEAALLLRWAVAGEAAIGEQGLNVTGKID